MLQRNEVINVLPNWRERQYRELPLTRVETSARISVRVGKPEPSINQSTQGGQF